MRSINTCTKESKRDWLSLPPSNHVDSHTCSCRVSHPSFVLCISSSFSFCYLFFFLSFLVSDFYMGALRYFLSLVPGGIYQYFLSILGFSSDRQLGLKQLRRCASFQAGGTRTPIARFVIYLALTLKQAKSNGARAKARADKFLQQTLKAYPSKRCSRHTTNNNSSQHNTNVTQRNATQRNMRCM